MTPEGRSLRLTDPSTKAISSIAEAGWAIPCASAYERETAGVSTRTFKSRLPGRRCRWNLADNGQEAGQDESAAWLPLTLDHVAFLSEVAATGRFS
jgi:hypothetical protein